MIVILFAAVVIFGSIGLTVYLQERKAAADVAGPPAGDVVRAIHIVWYQVYGMQTYPPAIRWITGKALNCANGTGFKDSAGVCVAGESWFDQKRSDIAWVKGEKLSDTALAHELCHHYLDSKGTPDPDHTGPAFAAGGIKDQANDALRVLGL